VNRHHNIGATLELSENFSQGTMMTRVCFVLLAVLPFALCRRVPFHVEQRVSPSTSPAASPVPSPASLIASVFTDDSTQTMQARFGRLDFSAIANGWFDDSLNTTGWGVLDIKTNASYDDDIQARAAG
jgi:hypothetical protein